MDSDQKNIEAANNISRLYQKKKWDHQLSGLIHIEGATNLSILKDYLGYYQDLQNFELNEFNISKTAMRSLYDTYPPHHFKPMPLKSSNTNIAVIGFNREAEAFIIENMILSHYPDGFNINVWLYHPKAEEVREEMLYKYPFLVDYLNLHPVTIRDERFESFSCDIYGKPYPKKIFNISYAFADDDSEVIVMAKRFRQFLYATYSDINQTPIIACLPEEIPIIDLIDMGQKEFNGRASIEKSLKEDFNIRLFRKYHDGCKKANLIDMNEVNEKLAKVINYYYALQYNLTSDYAQKHGKPMSEEQLAVMRDVVLNARISGPDPLLSLETQVNAEIDKIDPKFKEQFSISSCWKSLTDRKKDSNRYAARHLDIKLTSIKGFESDLDEVAKILAPTEHKRWCAEEQVLDYRWAEFPEDKDLKSLLKNDLKIHDLIMPFSVIREEHGQKDADLFRLLPVLGEIKQALEN
jgi:hypothetical protein